MIPRRPQSHYLSFYEDPEDWTPIVRVTCGTPVYLRTGGLIFRDEQPHDITHLLLRDLSAVAPITHLLGKEMIDGEVFLAHQAKYTSSFLAPLPGITV
jgi:hypothetical protein